MRGRQWEAALLGKLRDLPPPAFILGGASSQTLGFARSLGRRGIPAVALSTEPGPWLWSRYCVARDTADTEAALLARLIGLGSRLPRKGVVLGTGDAEVLFLSRHREELGTHYHLVVPPAGVVERLADKRSQYQYAAGLGIRIPPTYYPEGPADVEKLADVVRFPCIVKPAHSHLWRDRRRQVDRWRWTKVIHIETPHELRAVCEWMRERGVEVLVQGRVEGEESRLYALYAYLDRRSEPLATCVIQKRRQWPPLYGSGSYAVTCRQDRVVELGLTLLRRIGYQGVANLEFKLDPDDGELKLIEVNYRSGERIDLALAAGVDIPYIAYRDILGEPTVPARTHTVGVSWINSVNDCAALLSYYRRVQRLSWWGWARTVLTARSHAYFAWDDPMPFLGNLAATARRELVPFCRSIRRRSPASRTAG